MQNPKETIRSHCNLCSNITKQFVLARREVDKSDEIEEYGTITAWDRYELLECGGCESVSMRHTSYHEFDDGETVVNYPPKVTRKRPPWIWELPGELLNILRQVYTALDASSMALAVMGARTLIDLLLTDKVGDIGTFADKLNALERTGMIGKNNRAFLEAALEAGNAAAHRGHNPRSADVEAVMDIVENVLHAAYFLESQAEQLKRTTPPRTKTSSGESVG